MYLIKKCVHGKDIINQVEAVSSDGIRYMFFDECYTGWYHLDSGQYQISPRDRGNIRLSGMLTFH